LALRTFFQERMPGPGDAADVVIVDTANGDAVRRLDRSRGWNPQQGTMFYWNPAASRSQFFFNDRDEATGKVFTVLYDVVARRRVREYRFDDTPVATGGVAQRGVRFLALNYGRLARLRRVTGYPGAHDYTGDALHPADDGIHMVDVASGARQLLVSYRRLADLVRTVRPDVDRKALFINHTLWSRDDSHIYFYVRAEFDTPAERIDIPCTIRPDGTGLTMHEHIGGHPEWRDGTHLIGVKDNRQVVYDIASRRVVDTLGAPEVFPQPGGDIALSPDGGWLVNGHSLRGINGYTVLSLADGTWARTPDMSRGAYTSGELRIDGAPAWNRSGDAFLFPGLDPKDGTRQMFMTRIVSQRPAP
ncbi:MAG: hypothetical protein H0V80_13800, partial [Acidobacteria bacterium]|nr:hypothetical protein [Acidobacteriota bacterium]